MTDEPIEQHLALGRALEQVVSWLRRGPRAGDMSVTGLSLLDRLDAAGPQRVTDLAGLESISQPAATALVNRLENAGWVRRGPDPSDGRAQIITLNTAGAERLRQHRAERSRRIAERLARLDPADQAALLAALPALTHLAAPHRTRPDSRTTSPDA